MIHWSKRIVYLGGVWIYGLGGPEGLETAVALARAAVILILVAALVFLLRQPFWCLMRILGSGLYEWPLRLLRGTASFIRRRALPFSIITVLQWLTMRPKEQAS